MILTLQKIVPNAWFALLIAAVSVFALANIVEAGGGGSSSSGGGGGGHQSTPSTISGSFTTDAYVSAAVTSAVNSVYDDGNYVTQSTYSSSGGWGYSTVSPPSWGSDSSDGSSYIPPTGNNIFSPPPPPPPPPPGPVVDMRVHLNGTAQPKSGSYTISVTDALNIAYTVTTSDPATLVCNGLADYSTDVVNDSALSRDLPPNVLPTPGTTRTYTLECTDSLGGPNSDSMDVSIPAASTMLFEVRENPGIWEDTTSLIPAGALVQRGVKVMSVNGDVDFQWSSTNATDCQGSILPPTNGAGGFSTGGLPGDPTPATDLTITPPDIGQAAVFNIDCNGLGGDSNGQVEVQRPAPIPDLFIYLAGTTNEATLVDIGTQVDVYWDLKGNDQSNCSLTGPNWSTYNPVSMQTFTHINFTIEGESEFVLDCAANTLSPTTGQPINAASNISRRVNVTSVFLED